MSKKYDLVGKRFGRWTVIKRANNRLWRDKSTWYWLCKCDCGNGGEISTAGLIGGVSKSCGCYRRDFMKVRDKLERGLCAKRTAFKNYKQSAKQRKVSFELTFEQFMELTQSRCHYCNSEPKNLYKFNSGNFVYQGIDRVDNTKGYIIENCVPCCKICGRAKMDLPLEEFMSWVKSLIKYQSLK